jgi:hypothetical protein
MQRAMGRTMRLGAPVVAALMLAAPAAAQSSSSSSPNQPAQPGQSAQEDRQQFRYQMQTFENALQTAVRHGGDAFARLWVQSIPPGVQLTLSDSQVRGFAPPQGGGLLFYVAVPAIRPTVANLLYPDGGDGSDRQPQGPLQPMAASGRRAAPGVQGLAAVDGDPVTASPVIDDGRCATRVKPSEGHMSPDYTYAISVCDALMDAMLDSSGPLPVKDTDYLTVMAADGEPYPASYLGTPDGLTTYLTIKGSDLIAYRQGRITKEQARKLVDLSQR